MDIFIKNMEMPKEGRLVLAICPDGAVYEYFGDKNKYGGYVIDSAQKYLVKSPAVALPEHGDLIDEDEFRLVIYREIRNHKGDEPITMILKGILWEMDNAPVIVEATE